LRRDVGLHVANLQGFIAPTVMLIAALVAVCAAVTDSNTKNHLLSMLTLQGAYI